MRGVKIVRSGALLLIALTVSVGVWTDTTSWASGVSVESEAIAMNDHTNTLPDQLDATISTALIQLRDSGSAVSGVADNFYASYVTAGEQYKTALISAAEQYANDSQTSAAAAKDSYLDNFNHARDDYLNNLTLARNSLASELAGTYSPQKDAFIDQFNGALATFSSQLNGVESEIEGL